jgi:hypothetical protein
VTAGLMCCRVWPVLADLGRHEPENWLFRAYTGLIAIRNRHWQSLGRYHQKLPNSPMRARERVTMTRWFGFQSQAAAMVEAQQAGLARASPTDAAPATHDDVRR